MRDYRCGHKIVSRNCASQDIFVVPRLDLRIIHEVRDELSALNGHGEDLIASGHESSISEGLSTMSTATCRQAGHKVRLNVQLRHDVNVNIPILNLTSITGTREETYQKERQSIDRLASVFTLQSTSHSCQARKFDSVTIQTGKRHEGLKNASNWTALTPTPRSSRSSRHFRHVSHESKFDIDQPLFFPEANLRAKESLQCESQDTIDAYNHDTEPLTVSRPFRHPRQLPGMPRQVFLLFRVCNARHKWGCKMLRVCLLHSLPDSCVAGMLSTVVESWRQSCCQMPCSRRSCTWLRLRLTTIYMSSLARD